MIIPLMAQTVTYVSLSTIRLYSDQGRKTCLLLLLVFFFCFFCIGTSSYLTARLALLLCIDVDGGLVDTCECVVPWIVSGGMRYKNHFKLKFSVHGNQWKKGICIQNGP